MKAKSMKYGKGNKGGMKDLPTGGADKKALKKGAIASAKQPMDASDSEAEEAKEAAPTAGLPKSPAGTNIHKMGQNLLGEQDGMHEAGGFVSGKSY